MQAPLTNLASRTWYQLINITNHVLRWPSLSDVSTSMSETETDEYGQGKQGFIHIVNTLIPYTLQKHAVVVAYPSSIPIHHLISPRWLEQM